MTARFSEYQNENVLQSIFYISMKNVCLGPAVKSSIDTGNRKVRNIVNPLCPLHRYSLPKLKTFFFF